MNPNNPHIVLIGVFLSRIMLPVTNGFYILSEFTAGQGGLWSTLATVNFFLEMIVLMALVIGFHSSELRRAGAYITFGLTGVHYALIMIHVIFFPDVRYFIGPVFPIVLTVAYAVTAVLGYLTLRGIDERASAETNEHSGEIGDRAEVSHDRPDSNS